MAAVPVIDISGLIREPDGGPRAAGVARALDRALRAQHMWVPHWYKAAHNVVHWDIFGKPDIKPNFNRAILDTWWIDAGKAAAIKRGP